MKKIPTRVTDLLVAAGLCLTGLILFLPFRSRYLYNWDSVQFSLALRHFSVMDHTPHPPGYPLYVLAGKAAGFFWPDPNSAYIAVSIIFAVLTIALFYRFARVWSGISAAALLTLIYLTNPVFWGNSLVALSYTAEGFWSLLMAYLIYRTIETASSDTERWPKYFSLTTAVFALALGFRQGLLIFFLPLYLFCLAYILADRQRLQAWPRLLKVLGLNVIIFSGIFFLWYLPFLYLAGGYAVYRQAFKWLWGFTVWSNSYFGGGREYLWTNLGVLGLAVAYGFFLGWVPVLFAAFKKDNWPKAFLTAGGWFWLLWIMPAVLFYGLVYIRRTGYILTFLPALYLLLSLSWRGWTKSQRLILALIIMISNIYLFLCLPQAPLSAGEIQEHDRLLELKIRTIRQNFPPDRTVVLTMNDFNDGWRTAMYYLPDFRVYHITKIPPRLLSPAELAHFSATNHKRYYIQAYDHGRTPYLDKIIFSPSVRWLILWNRPLAKIRLLGDYQEIPFRSEQPGVLENSIYYLPVQPGQGLGVFGQFFYVKK